MKKIILIIEMIYIHACMYTDANLRFIKDFGQELHTKLISKYEHLF